MIHLVYYKIDMKRNFFYYCVRHDEIINRNKPSIYCDFKDCIGCVHREKVYEDKPEDETCKLNEKKSYRNDTI